MKRILLTFLSTVSLLSPAFAEDEASKVPLTASIQEVQAATLEDSTNNEKPKKMTKKTKKSKKIKKQ